MFINLITNRRSIRKYKKDRVEDEKVDLLIEAALRSPSSRSLDPLEFIVIDDTLLLKKLSESKEHGSDFLKDAPMAIVVCADITKSDVWVEDASISSTFIQLMADSIGLSSCWIQIRKRAYSSILNSQKYVAGLLDLPEEIVVESIIAIGYPDEIKNPHNKANLNYKKIYKNKYSS